ncbi:uncharacterized protein [Rutidosis leptorrhynchoides]|uniref:uncharacterized protein isoform X2 n=1 Tax=Rutidosis leptorrhynchoides TaxID=125765 RepID=UPI003A990390
MKFCCTQPTDSAYLKAMQSQREKIATTSASQLELASHADNRRHLEGTNCSSSQHDEFRYKTGFQSRGYESLGIKERINQISWCYTISGAMSALEGRNMLLEVERCDVGLVEDRLRMGVE